MNLKEKFHSYSKESRQTLMIMFLLIIMFIVGITLRWDYIKEEIGGSVDRYVQMFNPDSITNKTPKT